VVDNTNEFFCVMIDNQRRHQEDIRRRHHWSRLLLFCIYKVWCDAECTHAVFSVAPMELYNLVSCCFNARYVYFTAVIERVLCWQFN
jgi:hypothetical protein